MSDHLRTQNRVAVAIDEAGRKAQGSVQWLLENRKAEDGRPAIENAPEIHYGNRLDFLVCGEEGFAAIAKDLRNAKSTVDIICWGFDPGMELLRGTHCGPLDADPGHEVKLNEIGDIDTWPRGMTYGRLLNEITTRPKNPVTVRLLIWFDKEASLLQNNMPGYTDVPAPWLLHPIKAIVQQAEPYGDKARHEYCKRWWQENLPDGKSGAGKNPNLHIVLRGVETSDVQSLMAQEPEEKDKPSQIKTGLVERAAGVSEKSLLEDYPTHHQKPILIDYAYEGGSKAVGYVMGLNAVTNYWDRTAHEIDDPLRECWSDDNVKKESAHENATRSPKDRISKATYRRTKPFQDYACRLVGPALKSLHQNFERGWNDNLLTPAALKTKELKDVPRKMATLPKNPAHGVQIVRTQPHEREKSIKELYFQATSFARNYIYIENQYFFYPEFARHLKKEREKFCDAWDRLPDKPIADVPRLHLFIVIPHPEDNGMVPRTFDTLTELGHSGAMPNQAELVDSGKASQNYANAKDAKYTIDLKDEHGDPLKVTATHKVLDRPGIEELANTLGLKVSVARLRTSGVVGGQMAYREIYIHSKLMLIDDVFVTLGSANINQRSMSVDSEINIAATGQEWAAALRERVFTLHSDGKIRGTGERALVPEVFKDWNDQMTDNDELRQREKPMNGFLLPFEDYRATTTMHASVTVPSSGGTAIV
jgi:phospholipase D1/2